MNYKRQIDHVRREIKDLQTNIDQVTYDLVNSPYDSEKLLEEYRQYSEGIEWRLKMIYDLQPFWRKLFGCLY